MLLASAATLFAGGAWASGAPPSAPVNTLDTIVADMRLRNDLPLRGYEDRKVGWYVGPGYNQMGNDPRTLNTARWFKDAHPTLVNGTSLRAMLPWLVIFDGAGDDARNVRVQMRGFRAYVQSRSSGRWIALGKGSGVPSGFATPKSNLFNGSIPEDKRTAADGSVAIKPPADRNFAWHGWWEGGPMTIDPYDIAAVFVTVHARLVVDDPRRGDDRDSARLLLQVGADYYPDTKTRWKVPIPAVATSRVKRIGTDWQAFSMTTFSDVGEQDPGGGVSEASFRRNPPPLH